MGRVLDEDLVYEILSVVGEIPFGKVATYGQIARLIGSDNYSRLVGRALASAQLYGDYPCHRVVNAQGRTAPGWSDQKRLLAAEGVTFLKSGMVDMKKHRWEC